MYKEKVQERVAEIKGIKIEEYNTTKKEEGKFKPDGSASYINPKNLVVDINKEDVCK